MKFLIISFSPQSSKEIRNIVVSVTLVIDVAIASVHFIDQRGCPLFLKINTRSTNTNNQQFERKIEINFDTSLTPYAVKL